MKCNVGKTDKVLRTIIGLALLAGGIAIGSVIMIVLAIIAFFTVVSSWCPVYAIFGIDTCKNKPHEKGAM